MKTQYLTSKNLRTVYFSLLEVKITFCGTMMADFIMEDGRCMLMAKVKNKEKEFSMSQVSTSTKGHLKMERGQAME